jgi:uncharacterized protein (TIGR02453 family)
MEADSMAARFTAEGLKFLRGLARTNDREWFAARKEIYEREVKAPMLAVIEEINRAMEGFAPEHVRPAQKVMMRIYRDTRFAADKRPYKTHASAWWVRSGLANTSGAGYYFSVSAKVVVIAAGMYMPTPEQLLAVRRHVAEHHDALRGLLAAKKLREAMPEFEGKPLAGRPRGFAADSPGIDLVRCRVWAVSIELPAEAALEAGLVKDVARRFKAAAGMVDFLNAPLVPREIAGSAR